MKYANGKLFISQPSVSERALALGGSALRYDSTTRAHCNYKLGLSNGNFGTHYLTSSTQVQRLKGCHALSHCHRGLAPIRSLERNMLPLRRRTFADRIAIMMSPLCISLLCYDAMYRFLLNDRSGARQRSTTYDMSRLRNRTQFYKLGRVARCRLRQAVAYFAFDCKQC
jgi:hypothetical protein